MAEVKRERTTNQLWGDYLSDHPAIDSHTRKMLKRFHKLGFKSQDVNTLHVYVGLLSTAPSFTAATKSCMSKIYDFMSNDMKSLSTLKTITETCSSLAMEINNRYGECDQVKLLMAALEGGADGGLSIREIREKVAKSISEERIKAGISA